MITEALLEMHFHSALIELFSTTFGKNFLQLLKPSPQNERWVGFDQGWVYTSMPMNDFFQELRSKVNAGATTFDKLYLAYFFQFKTVDEITRGSKLKPTSYNTPYFRSELSLHPNKTTGISQHETLLKLCNIPNTEVSYACGMLFETSELYEKPDLSKLRFVPLSNAPTGWTTNERHFLTFQNQTDANPLWCSKPIDGISLTIGQVLERQGLHLLTPEELLRLFATINNVLTNTVKDENFIKRENRIESYYPECFTVLEFENNGS